jgi:RNA polymerase sigma-70 factor (ECF subfamily)
MDERDWLTTRFEENRTHLRKVAHRMLGSFGEADDAVQEAWVRLSRVDVEDIQNLGGWLTTVVSRVCLDMLRSRQARCEASFPAHPPEPLASGHTGPEHDTLLADSIGSALLVVLDALAPAERVALVLHDMFDLPYEDIAAIIGRSEAATRQLASRARRRVQGTDSVGNADRVRRREVVDAFLVASREGNFDALLAVLSPDVVLRADDLAVRTAAANNWGGSEAPQLSREVRGAQAVAQTFKGRARGARFVLIDGEAGAAWAPAGNPQAAFVFRIESGRIVEIDLIMDPARLKEFEIQLLRDET